MKLDHEVLMKSFGNGVMMLRFHSDQTPESAANFLAEMSAGAQEFLIGPHATDVFVLLDEGHPVTVIEVRNTEDEWKDLADTVRANGSKEFLERVENLGLARNSLTSTSPVA